MRGCAPKGRVFCPHTFQTQDIAMGYELTGLSAQDKDVILRVLSTWTMRLQGFQRRTRM